jgi:NAD+ diphosphatase
MGSPDPLVPLGSWHGAPVWGADVAVAPDGLAALDWLGCVSQPDRDLTAVAARAIQVARFRREHRYCGACGTGLEDSRIQYGRVCPACGLVTFASSQPVALVAVWRDGPHGREVLLARHTYGAAHLWVLVGGYVDAAETLEHAARREVTEEVGLAVDSLTYYGSEAWGLNGTGVLLALFTAVPADPATEPAIDRRELAEARFFPLTALPEPLPPAGSIVSRALAYLAAL